MNDTHIHIWTPEGWCPTCGISRSDAEDLPTRQPITRSGRKKGSKNYGAVSNLASRFRQRNLDWCDEVVRVYSQYCMDKTQSAQPDRTLLDFWMAALPYVCQTINEKVAMRTVARSRPKSVSEASIAALKRLESR